MSSQLKILGFAGSTRSASVNKQLLKAAAHQAGTHGIDVTIIDLKEYPLPLYDGDEEESGGMPANALKIKQLIAKHDAVCIASPEYNASLTGVLKNTIDWTSRPGGEDDPGAVWQEQPVVLFSASPGGLGGIRALNHLRAVLLNVSALVLPAQFALGQAHTAFDDQGHLKDATARDAVDNVWAQLAKWAQKL